MQLVPFAISVPSVAARVGRGRFGLPRRAFVFLFAFDYYSYAARKNPQATVAAFQKAFGDDPDVMLVIKTVHAKACPDDHAKMLAAVGGARNVKLVNEVLSRNVTHAGCAAMRTCRCTGARGTG